MKLEKNHRKFLEWVDNNLYLNIEMEDLIRSVLSSNEYDDIQRNELNRIRETYTNLYQSYQHY